MKTRKKTGPGKNELTAWQEWYVQPEGDNTFTNPVILLTSRWSQSAAETFSLGMRENDNVTLVGDYTAGGFSDVVAKELPNGWIYFVSIGDYRASDGTSYEGKGVPPDVFVVNKKDELEAGTDKALEYAIAQLSK